MLPNLYIPSYKLFGLLPVEPFGVLVALAMVVGYLLARRRARVTGLDPELLADSTLWVVGGGFVVAHLVSVIFYFPEQVLENPLTLLYVWSGISSFGGFIGGAVAVVVYFRRLGLSALKYAEAYLFGFVPAWIIGRMGCTIVFDHPGLRTEFILGMADRAGVIRHNLGFYEMLLAVPIAALLYALKNVRWFDGFHLALVLLLYSPVRFLLDYLRVQDKTYLGLTPGQYLALAMVGVSLGLIARGVLTRNLSGAQKAAGAENAGSA